MEQQHVDRPIDTVDGLPSAQRVRRGRNFRRVGLAFLLLAIVASCVGWFGPKSSTRTMTAADGTVVELEYPKITRPGLEQEVRLTASRPAGFAKNVVVALSESMYEQLGIERIDPEPVSQSADHDMVYLTFATPGGAEFALTVSGRTPTRQTPGSYRFTVKYGADAESPTRFGVDTWVLP